MPLIYCSVILKAGVFKPVKRHMDICRYPQYSRNTIYVSVVTQVLYTGVGLQATF